MKKPEGIIPAMVTPFTPSGELDELAVRRLVNRLIGQGVHGLFCLGTNGEFFSMTAEEKIRMVELVVQETAGRVPVYAGPGANSTGETVYLSGKFAEAGADALSVITPYFLGLTQNEIFDYYRATAESTALPVILYNIPARTGVSIQPGTAERLAAIPNIVGIKDSSGDFENILQYIRHAGPDFHVMAGTDNLILWTLLAGGTGAVASTANLVPDLVVSIYEQWKLGNREQAAAAQERLLHIRQALQTLGTLPSVLKEAMNLLGMDVGLPRSPVSPLTEAARGELGKVLQAYAETAAER